MFPQFRVDHYHYLPASLNIEVYVLLSQADAASPWVIPAKFGAAITRLLLKASANNPQFPNAYVVSAAQYGYATAALALAAATLDYNALIADRTAAYNAGILATGGTDPTVISPFADSPVLPPA
jgi:hypothetical protein